MECIVVSLVELETWSQYIRVSIPFTEQIRIANKFLVERLSGERWFGSHTFGYPTLSAKLVDIYTYDTTAFGNKLPAREGERGV